MNKCRFYATSKCKTWIQNDLRIVLITIMMLFCLIFSIHHCRDFLKIARPFRLSTKSWFDEIKFGGEEHYDSIVMNYIASNYSMIPRTFSIIQKTTHKDVSTPLFEVRLKLCLHTRMSWSSYNLVFHYAELIILCDKSPTFILQFGYRADGLETVVDKLTVDSAVRTHSDLRNAPRITKPFTKVARPSLTLFAKIMDQHVAFMHFDESKINDFIAKG